MSTRQNALIAAEMYKNPRNVTGLGEMWIGYTDYDKEGEFTDKNGRFPYVDTWGRKEL